MTETIEQQAISLTNGVNPSSILVLQPEANRAVEKPSLFNSLRREVTAVKEALAFSIATSLSIGIIATTLITWPWDRDKAKYESNPKHAGGKRGGFVSPEPDNGDEALRSSVSFSNNSDSRIAVQGGQIVMLRPTDDSGTFHGYAVEWNDLTQAQKNALTGAGLTDRRGRIK